MEHVLKSNLTRYAFGNTSVIRNVLLGFIATALIAISAVSIGWRPTQKPLAELPFVQTLQTTTFGEVAGALTLIVGVCLLLYTWLQLGQDISNGYITRIKEMWILLAAWTLPLVLAPPLFSRDVYSYVAQGKVFNSGFDPYVYGPSVLQNWLKDGVDPLWSNSPSPYGQLFLLLSQFIVGFVGEHPYVSAILFRSLALLGVALLAWAVPKLATYCKVNPVVALWLGVLNPLIFMHFISGAHNDALMVGLIAAGFVLVLRKKVFFGIMLVVAAGAIKPIGLVALPFLAVLWAGSKKPRKLALFKWVSIGAITGVVLILLAALTNTGFGWINAISTSSSVKTWLSPPTAVAMAAGYLMDHTGGNITNSLVEVSRALAALAAVVILALLLFKKERNPIRALSLAFLTLVLLGPVVQPWYFLWSLPLLASTLLTKTQTKFIVYSTICLVMFTLTCHFCDGAGYL